MHESKFCTIAQIAQFLTATAEVALTAHNSDVEHYEHISHVLKRFDCRQRVGALLATDKRLSIDSTRLAREN